MNPITELPSNAQLVFIIRSHTDEGHLVTALLALNEYETLPTEDDSEKFTALIKPIDDPRFDKLDQNTLSLTLLVPIDDESFHLIPMARLPGMNFEHPDADASRAICTLIAGVKDMELRQSLLSAARRVAHQRHSYLLEALNFIRNKTSQAFLEGEISGEGGS